MKAVLLDGKIINIGDWDNCEVEQFDEDGKSIGYVITNPLPSGAISGDFDIVKTEDGRYLLSNDNSYLVDEAKKYLLSTDWYYARKMETGEEVPTDIVEKRISARDIIRGLQ